MALREMVLLNSESSAQYAAMAVVLVLQQWELLVICGCGSTSQVLVVYYCSLFLSSCPRVALQSSRGQIVGTTRQGRECVQCHDGPVAAFQVSLCVLHRALVEETTKDGGVAADLVANALAGANGSAEDMANAGVTGFGSTTLAATKK